MSLNLENFKNKNIHVVGISGLEGWAMLDFFLSLGFKNITAHDFVKENELTKNFLKNHPGLSKKEKERSLLKLPSYKKKIKIFFKKDYLRGIKEADLIFVPQSWFLYKENKALIELKNKIPFLGIINIYFSLTTAKIISVTGSQGKTTTCRLIYHIFKEANRNVYYGGNDKKAAQCLSMIPKMKKADFLILEVSHRQLMNIKGNLQKVPHIAVILNISKNHLDEVKNFKEYQKLKRKILLFQGKKDFSILNFDNLPVRNFSKSVKGKLFFFSGNKKLDGGTILDSNDNFLKVKIKDKEKKIIKKTELSLQAIHHLENILAAIMTSYLGGIDPHIIKRGVETFPWPQNCFEYLGKIKEVHYYNNLASATPESTEAAIKTLVLNENIKTPDKNLILITGGEDKGMSYRNLVKIIKKNQVMLIMFPDSVSKRIKKLFKKEKKEVKEVKNLSETLKVIRKEAHSGDIVLLSPSGAFFQSRYGSRKAFLRLLESFN